MEPGPFIPLTSDYGFKATFGNEGNTLFLRTALQALIKSPVPIREVQLEKSAFKGLTLDSRSGIFDLACTDEAGTHFIVEMQLCIVPECDGVFSGLAFRPNLWHKYSPAAPAQRRQYAAVASVVRQASTRPAPRPASQNRSQLA